MLGDITRSKQMNTKNYRVSVGSANIVLNRCELELRAQEIGMPEGLIEEKRMAKFQFTNQA